MECVYYVHLQLFNSWDSPKTCYYTFTDKETWVQRGSCNLVVHHQRKHTSPSVTTPGRRSWFSVSKKTQGQLTQPNLSPVNDSLDPNLTRLMAQNLPKTLGISMLLELSLCVPQPPPPTQLLDLPTLTWVRSMTSGPLLPCVSSATMPPSPPRNIPGWNFALSTHHHPSWSYFRTWSLSPASPRPSFLSNCPSVQLLQSPFMVTLMASSQPPSCALRSPSDPGMTALVRPL